MAEDSIELIDRWRGVSLPATAVVGCDPSAARVVLGEIRRVRSLLAAVEAELITVLRTETGRDTKAALMRSFGMSSSEALKAEQVAAVVDRVPGASEALANGSVTGEHLRHLKPITDEADAAELLVVAAGQAPDEFGKTVDQFRIDRDPDGWRDRQRKARSLRFFKAEEGCVGMRVVLPTIDGERVRAAINDQCDAAWRAKHPERAKTAGGHDDEPREQRMPDALVALVTGEAKGAAGGRVSVVITVQAETLEAHLLGSGPVTTDDAVDLVGAARTELYVAIKSARGEILKFGRSRRAATAIQKLALAVRENGMCTWDACTQRWDRCDAHHDPPWDEGGVTDLDKMTLLCRGDRHPHRHETGEVIEPGPDGTHSVIRVSKPRPRRPRRARRKAASPRR
jgi:hypothetical protein